MSSTADRYKSDLESLVHLGDQMVSDLYFRAREREGKLPKSLAEGKKAVAGAFDANYQRWYTEAHAVMRQLIPSRLQEFEALYKGEPKRKQLSLATYTIQDWLTGIRAGENAYTGEKAFDDLGAVLMRFQTQLAILKSAHAHFDSTLLEIRRLLQADLFDSELDAARELFANGFVRAAGAVAGVVLEAHLSQVLANHGHTIRKKNPGISDYNDALKDVGVLDVPQWRSIQRLADLRNLCDHKKEREPTPEELEELISGVDKVAKSLS
jgi:hypothetical protein